MRQFFYSLWIFTAVMSIPLISCEKENKNDSDNNCNVSNPAEEIDWLKEAIDNVKEDEYSYFLIANYNGETVFYYGNCNPAANYVSIIRNCNGDNLGSANELTEELTDITILWKHEESKCNFQE